MSAVGFMTEAPARLRVLALLLLAPVSLAWGAGDPYLDELKAEAESGGARVDRASVEAPATSTAAGKAATPVDVDRAGFEQRFEEVRPSTFSAYGKLTETQKQQVYEDFKSSGGDYNKLVLEVMRLRFQPDAQ